MSNIQKIIKNKNQKTQKYSKKSKESKIKKIYQKLFTKKKHHKILKNQTFFKSKTKTSQQNKKQVKKHLKKIKNVFLKYRKN